MGLVLLVYELQQNRQLVRAELGSEATIIMREIQLASALDQEMSAIIARASFGGEKLSDAELVSFDSYLEASIQLLHRERYLLRLGLFDDDPAFMAEIWAGAFLNNPTAVKWWESKKSFYDEDFVVLIDSALASERAREDSTQLMRFRSDVNAHQK